MLTTPRAMATPTSRGVEEGGVIGEVEVKVVTTSAVGKFIPMCGWVL